MNIQSLFEFNPYFSVNKEPKSSKNRVHCLFKKCVLVTCMYLVNELDVTIKLILLPVVLIQLHKYERISWKQV